MTKGYTTLVNKLDELETMLMQLMIPLPPDNEQYHINLSQDIEQTLDFVKDLVSSEFNASTFKSSIASATDHDDLDLISRRLALLDSSFRQWQTQLDKEEEEEEEDDDDVDDTCSLCMGTYAGTFNEEAFTKAVEDDRTVRIDHRTRGEGMVGVTWKNCLVMGFGIFVGALSMLTISDFLSHHYFHMETRYQCCITPT